MLFRIIALFVKELQSLLRDKQSRMALIMPVIMQLALFPFAATLEVSNNTLAVENLDGGRDATEIIHRLAHIPAFSRIVSLHGEAAIQTTLDQQEALLVIRFPADFSSRISSGQPATIQALLDGRRSNSGQIALGSIQNVVQAYSAERLSPPSGSASVHTELIVRHWFNPNLSALRHILPSLVAIITTLGVLILTSLSVAREREQGTMDQLLVSPLTPAMIMIGKTVPALLVATVQATIILVAAVLVYRVPFVGSLILLYGSIVLYSLALAGFGLLISTICATQQQAFLGIFSFLMPAILLSGFVAPVENMPLWLQYLDWLNPLRHFIVIVKGLFLKDLALAALFAHLWPLLVIATTTLGGALLMFRRQ